MEHDTPNDTEPTPKGHDEDTTDMGEVEDTGQDADFLSGDRGELE